jgi:hypothetical protein
VIGEIPPITPSKLLEFQTFAKKLAAPTGWG